MELLTRPQLMRYLASLPVKQDGIKLSVGRRKITARSQDWFAARDKQTYRKRGAPCERIDVILNHPQIGAAYCAEIVIWHKRGKGASGGTYSMSVESHSRPMRHYPGTDESSPRFPAPDLGQELRGGEAHLIAHRISNRIARQHGKRIKKLEVDTFVWGDRIKLEHWVPIGNLTTALDAIENLKEAK